MFVGGAVKEEDEGLDCMHVRIDQIHCSLFKPAIWVPGIPKHLPRACALVRDF